MPTKLTWTGKRIKSLSLYKEVGGAVTGLPKWLAREFIPFVIAYAYVFQWCYQTSGDPYREALEKAEREGLAIPDTVEHLREQASAFLSGESPLLDETTKKPSEDLLDASKTITLPSIYMPAFWPLLVLGIVVVLNVLLILLQVWSVAIKCMIKFTPSNNILEATHVKVVPSALMAKTILVPLVKEKIGYTFTFHRRKYVYRDNCFTKIRCKADMPHSFFFKWMGFPTSSEVEKTLTRYGLNKFEMNKPTFMELYKQQLLSPFTVFQLFCVLLWCLDEYWQYSIFTLFMICTFEATTVMQRIKNIQTLSGYENSEHKLYVFRCGKWLQSTNSELLPGDVFSLTRSKEQDIVPCDCVLVHGSVVVNEASLTGESIPQMKEAFTESSDEPLNIKGADKVHTLFGGTRLLQVSGDKGHTGVDIDSSGDGFEKIKAEDNEEEEHEDVYVNIPKPPDAGCIAYSLRTGFSSSQGKLVRMIEGSTQSVRTDTKDTAFLLLFLLIFAVTASGYVLKRGMEDGDRSKYELLLHCILIITSVIPPELPMQMALAVNTSLMTLMKLHIFCTEPFKVPMAGKIDVTLFDKTGTLTTDELVAVGVSKRKFDNLKKKVKLDLMHEAGPEATMVLGACHSLMMIENKLAGDPLEEASLKAVKWEIKEKGKITECRPQEKQLKSRGGLTVNGMNFTSLEIMTRHHFASKLQRMSVVVRNTKNREQGFVLVKGSPEAIGARVVPGTLPDSYHEAAGILAKEGMRVLALGYKRLDSTNQIELCGNSRADAECDLQFAGFIAFTCRVRKDTKDIVNRLLEGNMQVIMITGDALLTGIHVAKDVNICAATKKGILILKNSESDGTIKWQDYETENNLFDYDPKKVKELSKSYDLCTTGKVLAAAMEKFEYTKKVLQFFAVYARMTPDEKENVINCIKACKKFCLMCGDGANDVGALKSADVGVALLSGFGDLNVDRGNKSDGPQAVSDEEIEEMKRLKPSEIKRKLRLININPDDHPDCVEKKDFINLYVECKQRQADAVIVKKTAEQEMAEKKAKMQLKIKENRVEAKKKQQEAMLQKKIDFENEVRELEAKGESWAQFKAMQKMWAKEMENGKEMKKKRQKEAGVANSAARMATMMDDMEEMELPMVKIGDASIAAPFTSKMPSIKAVVDIVRQGRCTLVTTIQMYQILALTCLISAYSLSVLYLDGIKYGDVQMTAMGILMSVSYVSISRAKPLDKLSPVRPFTTIFHPALFVSLLGQFLLHLGTMMYSLHLAKSTLPDDYKPVMDGEFKPGIVNTVVYLVSGVQQVSVFVVNLKGPPFMNGLTENRPLMYSLAGTFVLVVILGSEMIPKFNKYLELVPFPNTNFRNQILACLGIDIFCSFIWDRVMLIIFAPRVLAASLEGTTMKDVMGVVKVFVMVSGIVYFFAVQDYDELMEEMERLEREEAEAAALAAGGGSSIPTGGSENFFEATSSDEFAF